MQVRQNETRELGLSRMALRSVAFANADSDLSEVRSIAGLQDERLIPYACNSSHGSSEFRTPKAGSFHYCLATFGSESADTALIYLDRKGTKTAFRISNCKRVLASGDQEGGIYIDKCAIKKMDPSTLEVSGQASLIEFTTRWMYSEGGARFEFKKAGQKYFGAPVSLNELLHGYP